MILIGFFAVVAVYVGKPMINLAKDPETFRLWVDSHGFGGKLAMVGMMVLQVVVARPWKSARATPSAPGRGFCCA